MAYNLNKTIPINNYCDTISNGFSDQWDVFGPMSRRTNDTLLRTTVSSDQWVFGPMPMAMGRRTIEKSPTYHWHCYVHTLPLVWKMKWMPQPEQQSDIARGGRSYHSAPSRQQRGNSQQLSIKRRRRRRLFPPPAVIDDDQIDIGVRQVFCSQTKFKIGYFCSWRAHLLNYSHNYLYYRS